MGLEQTKIFTPINPQTQSSQSLSPEVEVQLSCDGALEVVYPMETEIEEEDEISPIAPIQPDQELDEGEEMMMEVDNENVPLPVSEEVAIDDSPTPEGKKERIEQWVAKNVQREPLKEVVNVNNTNLEPDHSVKHKKRNLDKQADKENITPRGSPVQKSGNKRRQQKSPAKKPLSLMPSLANRSSDENVFDYDHDDNLVMSWLEEEKKKKPRVYGGQRKEREKARLEEKAKKKEERRRQRQSKRSACDENDAPSSQESSTGTSTVTLDEIQKELDQRKVEKEKQKMKNKKWYYATAEEVLACKDEEVIVEEDEDDCPLFKLPLEKPHR